MEQTELKYFTLNGKLFNFETNEEIVPNTNKKYRIKNTKGVEIEITLLQFLQYHNLINISLEDYLDLMDLQEITIKDENMLERVKENKMDNFHIKIHGIVYSYEYLKTMFISNIDFNGCSNYQFNVILIKFLKLCTFIEYISEDVPNNDVNLNLLVDFMFRCTIFNSSIYELTTLLMVILKKDDNPIFDKLHDKITVIRDRAMDE